MTGYIYIIHEREFIKTNEKIYKIGKTQQETLGRLNNYPKGSNLLFHIVCENYNKMETELINIFKLNYKQRTDIGREYFQGNITLMVRDIFNHIMNSLQKTENIYEVSNIFTKSINKFETYSEETIIEEIKQNFIFTGNKSDIIFGSAISKFLHYKNNNKFLKKHLLNLGATNKHTNRGSMYMGIKYKFEQSEISPDM